MVFGHNWQRELSYRSIMVKWSGYACCLLALFWFICLNQMVHLVNLVESRKPRIQSPLHFTHSELLESYQWQSKHSKAILEAERTSIITAYSKVRESKTVVNCTDLKLKAPEMWSGGLWLWSKQNSKKWIEINNKNSAVVQPRFGSITTAVFLH